MLVSFHFKEAHITLVFDVHCELFTCMCLHVLLYTHIELSMSLSNVQVTTAVSALLRTDSLKENNLDIIPLSFINRFVRAAQEIKEGFMDRQPATLHYTVLY